jgi:hypothetical protein
MNKPAIALRLAVAKLAVVDLDYEADWWLCRRQGSRLAAGSSWV